MIRLLIAWRNLWTRPLQSLLTIAVVATATTMTLVVLMLATSLQNGLTQATDPFDLIVGAKGSPNQLVLNTVLLQDVPIGNISYDIVKELRNNPLVETAVPLGFGDNYRGYRMVGTEAGLFSHRSKAGQPPWIELAQGHPFQSAYQAVLGAKTARETGLKIGDQFASSHGIAGGETHTDKKFTVVGIMQPVNGPYDQAILVSLDSLWHIHSHTGQPNAVHQEIDTHEQDHAVENKTGPAEAGTTVILVKPAGYVEAMKLYQQFQQDNRAQLIFPSQVIVRLFAILGQGQQVMTWVAYTVFSMALLMVALSLYWSALSRGREHTVLRALGAGRATIFAIILYEGTLLVLGGASAGTIAGYSLFSLLAGILRQKTALAATLSFSAPQLLTIIAIVAAGILASLIPAVYSSKTDIAHLSE